MKPEPGPSVLNTPSLPSISVLRDQMKDVKRQAEAAPRAEDFAKEAGASITYNADGSWQGTVRGAENIRRAVHMQDGSRKVEIERGQKLDATRPKERLVDGEGRHINAPVHLAEQIARKRGLHASSGRGAVMSFTGGWLPNAKDRERMARGED